MSLDLPALVTRAGCPGTRIIPAISWLLSLLALKLTRTRRVSHVDDLLADPAAGLLARAAATGDPAGRRRLAVQAEAALLGQLPVVPVLALRHAAVLLPGVRGFDLTPAGTVDLAAVSLDR